MTDYSDNTKVYAKEIDENCKEQIKEMANQEAFEGSKIRVMPDAHAGKGAVIGFTAPVEGKVVPNYVGVDVGCGMRASKLEIPSLDVEDKEMLREIDEKINEKVPMGFDVHNRSDYHMKNDFPWAACERTIEYFDQMRPEFEIEDMEYGHEYFTDLVDRVGYDMGRAINSVGTLGGGNHFIEIGVGRETGDVWCIIHSGSRGIGASIAEYWQDKATEIRTHELLVDNIPDKYMEYVKFSKDDSPDTILQWVQGGMGESYLKTDKIREDFDGKEIEETINAIKDSLRVLPDNRKTEHDYLEGSEATGYIKDMIFAQQYAKESREKMMRLVVEAIEDVMGEEVERVETESSVHNYIDFEDGIMRKGATPAREGERIIIPFNMKDGTLLCEGKGSEGWNQSAPHGAGRIMSRTKAFDTIDLDDYKEDMDGIVSSSVNENTIDEAPDAYKNTEIIEEEIKKTATIIDRIKPVINIKDDS